ncbi:B12-binding domain-containing radical SAM protein [Granulicella tundricola]|uniref:Radical SAM domain protein n=1 Tax=Granulicella tundricola (strain ATCC BAA-1859 / DSM 23138 / MP5ACTX9) TaxID=1198114 RepID=E8X4I8_GRATM|nr:radical SAM protein [Granulicella tundricola]ADW69398.1 Radical SAM domain protein [Granulicella tundricola MP5ACTX9]
MSVHLINPSDNSFGTAVITPRWLFVLAAATPSSVGDPILVDESIEQVVPESIAPGDIVGISVHTGNALRGYAVGRMARERGATVIYGGIHATLFPEECFERGQAHSVVKGDGDVAWGMAVNDSLNGTLQHIYDGGRIEGNQFLAARWDLMRTDKYMWASVQTIRGCPKHCSFCSVWRTDGQKPRQRQFQSVIDEIVNLRRIGFRFIALADDNFYPVTLTDLRLAREQGNQAKLDELIAIRSERFQLMEELSKLPKDMVFFTQITMEAGEDGDYLDAMRRANIKGALVGVEAVTPEGLKAVFKDFNYSGEALAKQLQTFKKHGVHVLGSFIFGLPTDKPATFDATVEMALKAGVTFAQFVMMTPFPGTVDFGRWEKEQALNPTLVGDIPITRYWLIPTEIRPKMFTPHPSMSSGEISERTQKVWDRFYDWGAIWERSSCTPNLKSRLAFILLSKLYRQMYAGTGISTDSARRKKSKKAARWTAAQTRKIFQAKPMPELQAPAWELAFKSPLSTRPAFLRQAVAETGPFAILSE